ncbi:MAG: bifunctional diaminohydroxyphosphoribosylaminopyrimidine deaminase/5-amino-6-(5-phosphoribosylamino)uracil reductase RibD [Moraxellaceae bacterium]|jgi:diaminohydroxyphosphoribosylaminopyrimidine deaminase/5-amino-6-(5-phosphoribosylamino)uracil reductase|nr:bifunctional diaminohydroxyphosphoribosylaminopyrimidine deaminase/5-amino-6-(5-phosphoribosylamino)uracil reductase RibD [Moraxellaceae bacterium]MBP9046224.1 bifunctional diaminohydroxyphosphoribosylaminopyrimidine deaminase/5-amino-6-(5-phosphoribosylamino)uracil reductase RibD [Moraxellaceae bacterium]MBP9731522.1 bifunctional diaminohydroxyphosphoribosylaminopyrimidine deaminase/5-amino-6-(5-phosphoribosylamino)uracil reductase RibD [Moraxellaceae bacterium]MCC6199998.1 bifunctional diam
MSFSPDDIRHMSEAIQLARRGRFTTQPNPRVGCVIVKDGVVVGTGYHARAGGPHAEVVALKQAGYRAYGATAYVTLEPCAHHGRTPPCANELVIAGLKRVVVAMEDPNPLVAGKGMDILRQAGITAESDLLADEARALNPGFLRRIKGGLPWTRVKLAASLDGRTAAASGESKWITGPDARRDVQLWRAMSSAIITGIGTVLADDPALTVRPDECEDWDHGEPVQPWRVVLDTDFRTPLTAKILKQPGRTIIVGIRSQLPRQTALRDAGAEIWVLDGKSGKVDLKVLLQRLADEGANEVLIEAGATVAGSAARAGLVDEYVIYQAPVLMGSSAKPLLDWPQQFMREQRKLVITDLRMVGNDIRLLARPKAL